jgi:protein SCO1
MTQRRTILIAVAALCFAAAGATLAVLWSGALNGTQAVGLGAGDYRLETTDGGAFTQDTLKGRPTAVFFGFTHCPDVCPTTMAEMVSWYEALGPAGDDLQSFFVTVDPERDTVDMLRRYVEWTGRVVGVSGSVEEAEKARAAFNVFAAKVPTGDGEYTMDHTASVFLMDRDGAFAGTIPYSEDPDVAVSKLRDLVAG